MKRRDILKGLGLLPLSGGVMGGVFASEKVFAEPHAPKRDLFKELGVRTFINARGNYNVYVWLANARLCIGCNKRYFKRFLHVGRTPG